MPFLPKHKKMVESILDREVQAGYRPIKMKLPWKEGCRICGVPKGEPKYTVSVVGTRMDPRKIYLWTIVAFCQKCWKKETSRDDKVLKIMLYRWSEGMVE